MFGGIQSVKTEMGEDGAVSRLYIANANKRDSGNYSCLLEDAAATMISVYVLNGTYKHTPPSERIDFDNGALGGVGGSREDE